MQYPGMGTKTPPPVTPIRRARRRQKPRPLTAREFEADLQRNRDTLAAATALYRKREDE